MGKKSEGPFSNGVFTFFAIFYFPFHSNTTFILDLVVFSLFFFINLPVIFSCLFISSSLFVFFFLPAFLCFFNLIFSFFFSFLYPSLDIFLSLLSFSLIPLSIYFYYLSLHFSLNFVIFFSLTFFFLYFSFASSFQFNFPLGFLSVFVTFFSQRLEGGLREREAERKKGRKA